MTEYHPETRPEPIDIANMYWLALGRDPEAANIIEERLSQPAREWMPGFFSASEFVEKVLEKVLAGAPVSGGLFERPPPLELRSWAARSFPLLPKSQKV